MVRRISLPLSAFLALLALTGCGPKTVTLEDYNTRLVTLPDGFQVRVEVMVQRDDLLRGMMFRDSLAEDRGMLFIHPQAAAMSYWMYKVKMPLDIIWMDRKGRIVEMSPNTPPCKSKASECPKYGGNVISEVVLEMVAGSIEKHQLRLGARIKL